MIWPKFPPWRSARAAPKLAAEPPAAGEVTMPENVLYYGDNLDVLRRHLKVMNLDRFDLR